MDTKAIAIIGAGPAGIYAAEALSKAKPEVQIYIFEALFCPYGLVRSGVAPDHYKIKEVSKLFDKTLSRDNVHFYGNIEIGKDITLSELRDHFSAIIFCTGAHKDRNLEIPGEDLNNVTTATNFVGWYNCHPWFQNQSFNLNHENVSIIGQGNVAVDVTRILLQDIEILKTTDISPLAINAIKESKIKNVYMIGRRGPLQAAFTDKELKELGELKDVHVNVNQEDLLLSSDEENWLAQAPKGLQKNYSILKEYSAREYQGQSRTLHICFFLSPTSFKGDLSVESIELVKNKLEGPLDGRKAVPTTNYVNINSSLVFKSVGYKGQNLENLPWDNKKGTFLNDKGLVSDGSSQIYTSGWIKRGPSGVVGTNKADSVETINTLLENFESLPIPVKQPKSLIEDLKNKSIKLIELNDWIEIEKEEVRLGNQVSQRKKFLSNQDAINFLTK